MCKKVSYISIMLVFVLTLTILNGCEFNVSTASFKNIETASEINNDTKEPITISDTFSTDAPFIYVTGKVVNAPEGTKVKASWIYLDMDPVFTIDEAELTTKHIDTAFDFSLSKPNDGWPVGQYEVKLYIDDNHKETVKFEVQ